MKRTIRFLTVWCYAISLFLLSACSGYNAQMIAHLGDQKNYEVYHGEICDIYYYDEEKNKISLFMSDELPESDLVLEIAFEDYNTVKRFLGADPNPNMDLRDFSFQFDVTKENSQILKDNGFFDTAAVNTSIAITASSFIYMDSDFFFIAGIVYNETEYLPFETGFPNIEKHINQHKSLL